MDRNDIVRMAREAGAYEPTNEDDWAFEFVDLEHFANLVAAAEREACAKACEIVWDSRAGLETGTAIKCAAAIRARGEK